MVMGTEAARGIRQFKTEYVLLFNDGSEERAADNPARQSEVFNTAVFTCAISDALCEFARNVADGTWRSRIAGA
jgi:hypothetical protein